MSARPIRLLALSLSMAAVGGLGACASPAGGPAGSHDMHAMHAMHGGGPGAGMPGDCPMQEGGGQRGGMMMKMQGAGGAMPMGPGASAPCPPASGPSAEPHACHH